MARRLAVLSAQLSAGAHDATRLPEADLLGGAGFTDAVGLKGAAVTSACSPRALAVSSAIVLTSGGVSVPRALAVRRAGASRRELWQRLTDLGLMENIAELDRDGYTVLRGIVPDDLRRRLRAKVIDITDFQLRKQRRSGVKFGQIGSLLYHGREFEEAAQLPEQMAVAEYLVGKNYGIWQYLASVRGQGTSGLPVHADLGPGWREPFQPLPEMTTSLFVLDEFGLEAGPTFVVPGTHQLCRRPRLNDADDRARILRDARAVVAEPGSVIMVRGSLSPAREPSWPAAAGAWAPRLC